MCDILYNFYFSFSNISNQQPEKLEPSSLSVVQKKISSKSRDELLLKSSIFVVNLSIFIAK